MEIHAKLSLLTIKLRLLQNKKMNNNIEWHQVASVDDVDDYLPLPVEVDDHQIALYLVDKKIYATTNICSHEHALLSDGYIEKGCVVCPIHQAKFEICSGKTQCAPATKDIKTYPIKVENDLVYVGII